MLFSFSVTDSISENSISFAVCSSSTDSFVIAYKDSQNKYHVLKTDGTQAIIDTVEDIDYLDNNYKWKFFYVFEEKDEDDPNKNRSSARSPLLPG